MKIKLAISAIALFSLSPSLAAETITFNQALARALQLNPLAARTRIDVDVARSQRRNLRSLILPQLDFSGTFTRNRDEIAFDFEDETTTVLAKNDWQYSITLSQPIFGGFREMRAIRQATIGIESAEDGVRRAEEGLLLGTAANYLAVIEGDDLVAVERINLELAQRRHQQARDFFEAGEVARVDVIRAETAIKAAERRVAAALQARDSAASRLRVDLALDEGIEIQRPELSLPAIASDADLIAQATAARPEIQQAEANLRIARLEIAKQRGAYLPTIGAEANYTKQRAGFPTDNYASVKLNFYVPLWTSGEVGSRVALAKQREKQAELALDELKRSVREEVQRTILDLRTADTNLALAREQLAAAEAEYEQMNELYRAQEATSLDLASSENALAEARRAVVAGTMNRDVARLRLWYAVGGLKEALNVTK